MIYARALSNSEIASLGPANSAPTLAAISNRTVPAGITLTITNTANDVDLPVANAFFQSPERSCRRDDSD
jgi:hypothetical protein